MPQDDNGISADEQKAFSDAHQLIDTLLKQSLDPAEVGKGFSWRLFAHCANSQQHFDCRNLLRSR
jgi:hypothetical protein